MNDSQYDLAVAYRIYPKISSHKPPIFPDDKFKLASLCLESFRQSLGTLRVKLWVLMDNCPPEYEQMFLERWPREDIVFKHYPGMGDAATFWEQAHILLEQTDSEMIYFAEDDYFYLPDQFPKAVRFLKQNPDVDFVSPYDHPDIYSTDLHKIPRPERVAEGKTWRSCMSTTHTFMTTRATLRDARWVLLRRYHRVSPDLARWMAMTKRRVFNPFFFARSLVTCPFWAGSMFYSWRYCWKQILFGRRFNLWVPHPTIANHMVAGMEASGVDWQKLFDDGAAALKKEKR